MIRDVLALASDALERQVITMWLSEGYVPATIQRRILDKRRIYRRLGRNEPASALARMLCFEKVSRIAQEEARRRPGDRKLNARIMMASLRAWADALRTLGKPIPAWISEASGDLIDEYWSYTRRVRALAEKTFNEHRLYITWFLEDLKKRKIALHAIALADVDHFVSTLTTERKLAVTSAANACICIRHFLRFLYRTKRLSTDLAPAVIGPTLRQMLKRPPERVSWAALKRVLGAIDRMRPLGKRDFAIFVTAASYGWVPRRSFPCASMTLIGTGTRSRLYVPRPAFGSRSPYGRRLRTPLPCTYRPPAPLTPENARSSCAITRRGPRYPLRTPLPPIFNDMQRRQASSFRHVAR